MESFRGGEADGVRALYLHLPFCVQKCAYCDFASRATRRGDPQMEAYARALRQELSELESMGLLARCETAYVGGGTPTLLGARSLGELVGAVRAAAPRIEELSCEANPDSLDDLVLDALVSSGATRLSVGVQSLSDAELRALGRVHDAALARRRVEAAVASGLDVSMDLMCAIPGQTDASWAQTLGQALKLGVGHLSIYPLQIEEGTPLGLRIGDDDPDWNDPDVQAGRMEQAEARIERAGLARYEVASYAAPGKQCRHNQAYWTGASYLGLGHGAASMLSREAYARLRERLRRLPALRQDTARVRLQVRDGIEAIASSPSLESRSFDLELLSEPQAVAEDLMLAFRMTRGADGALLERARSVLGRTCVDGTLSEVVLRGLACWQGGSLVPTHAGWLRGNELYGELWALAPGEVVQASC